MRLKGIGGGPVYRANQDSSMVKELSAASTKARPAPFLPKIAHGGSSFSWQQTLLRRNSFAS